MFKSSHEYTLVVSIIRGRENETLQQYITFWVFEKKEMSRNKKIICVIDLSANTEADYSKYIVYVHRTHSFETRNQITPKIMSNMYKKDR